MTNTPETQIAQTIPELLTRYDFPSISARYKPTPEHFKVRIGFVGEFSSGKSTLINAMIGKKLLPSRVEPTTATIITVEGVENLESPARFSVESDGLLIPVSAEVFSEIATGKKEGALVLHVPNNETMVSGLQLIDSPGLNSLMGGHSEATIAQLSLLDGLVICLNTTYGSVPATILEFIKRDEIRDLKQRTLFVLTFTDEKNDEGGERIRRTIEAQLKEAFQNTDSLEILEANAPASMKGEPHQLEKYFTAFKSSFVDQRISLLADRHFKHLKEMGGLLITALYTYLESLGFNPEEFEKKEAELRKQLEAINTARTKEKQRLDEWYLEFRKALNAEATMIGPRFVNAEVEELAAVYADLNSAFKRVTEIHIKKYSPGEGLNLGQIPNAQASALLDQLKTNAKYVDRGVTLATLAVTAAITAGAGAGAAVTGEAAGGAAAAEATAKQAAKGLTKEMSKNVFKQALQGLATVIKQINPLETAGDLIKGYMNDQEIAKQLPRIAAHLADSILIELQSHLEKTCFAPLSNQFAAIEDGLRETRAARELSVQDLREKRSIAQRDLQELSAALRQTS